MSDPIPIPLSLLYRLADDSSLGGLRNMRSVGEKLADLFGPGALILRGNYEIPEGLEDRLCIPYFKEDPDAGD
jgi:hypothetical protein